MLPTSTKLERCESLEKQKIRKLNLQNTNKECSLFSKNLKYNRQECWTKKHIALVQVAFCSVCFRVMRGGLMKKAQLEVSSNLSED